MIVLLAFIMWCAMIVLLVFLNVTWADERAPAEPQKPLFPEWYFCDDEAEIIVWMYLDKIGDRTW